MNKKGSRFSFIASSSSSSSGRSFISSVITLLLVVVSSSSPSTQVSSFSTSTTSVTAGKPIIPENPISAELLTLLLLKERTTTTTSTASKNSNDDESSSSKTATIKIDTLIQSLISSTNNNKFDPTTCINGDFFATIYTMGAKTPLWEKIAMASNQNLKGQKYTIGKEINKVVNYSEILGNAINLKAFGTFTDRGPVGNIVDTSTTRSVVPAGGDDEDNKSSSSPFSSIQNVLQSIIPTNKKSTNTNNNNNKLNLCPYDYDVTVTGASIDIFGLTIQIPISGTGCARVLYADPCLRIFISPNDTNVETGGGDWESAGLISIQVRIDLINPTWNIIL